MCAFTSLILGLGLTTTACYIFLAILVAPALEKLGLNRMAIHMFIFYWGMLSLDHTAGRDRLVCRRGHCGVAGDEDRMGIDVGRQHHLFHPVLLRVEPCPCAAGRQPPISPASG
jgi:hypothetical protein